MEFTQDWGTFGPQIHPKHSFGGKVQSELVLRLKAKRV